MAENSSPAEPLTLAFFPSEVLDDILGHVVESLPPDNRATSRSARKSLKVQELLTLSGVSRHWRVVALQRITTKVIVRQSWKAKAITKDKVGNFAAQIRELVIIGNEPYHDAPVSPEDISTFSVVVSDDILNLLHASKALQSLHLDRVRVNNIRMHPFLEPPSLAHLRHLHLNIMAFDHAWGLATDLLPLLTHLESLHFTSLVDTVSFNGPIPQLSLPTLQTLTLSGGVPLETFPGVFATPHLSKLDISKIHSIAGVREYIEILRSNLEVLVLDSYKGRRLAGLIAGATKLQHLIISTSGSIHHATQLLNDLPCSLSRLTIRSRSCKSLLGALDSTPRPVGFTELYLGWDQFVMQERRELRDDFGSRGVTVHYTS